MGVTFRSFILSFILIVAAAILYQLSGHVDQTADDSVLQQYPSFIAEDFKGDNFDRDGRLIHHIEAKDVTFFKNRSLLLMSEPSGIYYNYEKRADGVHDEFDRNPEAWHLSADQGQMVLDDEAELTGNVLLKPLFDSRELTDARTPYLHFDLKQNVISTDESVHISGPNFVNYGTGLRADLNEKKVYLHDPHAHYEFN